MTLKLPLLLACALLSSCAHGQTVSASSDIATGTATDIVLLHRNPLADIRGTRAIAAVAFKGEYLDRQALDAMLADVRAHVAEREAGEE